VIDQLTAPTRNPLTVQVSSDICSAPDGHLEKKFTFLSWKSGRRRDVT